MKIKYASIATLEFRESREFKSSTRAAPFTKKKNVITLGKVSHILKPTKIAHIQNQNKQGTRHKTQDRKKKKMLEFTREILNSDHVFKNQQNIKNNNYNNNKKKSIICCLFLDVVRH